MIPFTDFSLRHQVKIFLQFRLLLIPSQLRRTLQINYRVTMPPKAQSRLPFGKNTQSGSSNKRKSTIIDPEASSDVDSQPTINSTPAPSESDTPSQTFEPLQKQPNKKTLRTSFVYKWMRGTDNMQHVFYNAAGKEEWRCRFCLANYQISGGTRTIRIHLETHSIKEDSPADTKAKNV